MNFPIISSLILLPSIGALFLFFTRSERDNQKTIKYVALFTSLVNFFLSIYLWILFDQSTSEFQFVEDRTWIKDIVNYNVMLRKSYTLNIQNKWLQEEYTNLPTGIQLAMPWDLYASLIDKIPLQFRNHELNERLLIKSNKQKQVLEKILKVGYRLGKI